MRQQIEQAKAYWKFWENNVKLSILQEKYNALMAKTVTANSLDAKSEYAAAKRIVDVNYVVQPYFTVPDADVKVSQSEIKDRYNKMKEQFKMEANRSIKYVVFQVKASPEDYKKAQTEMNTLSAEFTTTADVAGFVNKNSEVRYDGKPYSEATALISNLFPVNAKGEVLFLSVLSNKISGIFPTTFSFNSVFSSGESFPLVTFEWWWIV